jgi:serine/threonine protein kinase
MQSHIACTPPLVHVTHLITHTRPSSGPLLCSSSEPLLCSAIGTPLYIAPEVLQGSDYNLRADVYSFAILMAEIIYRQEPFGDTLPMRVPNLVVSGVRPDLLVTNDNPINNLIRQCWSHAANSRPPMAEVLNR